MGSVVQCFLLALALKEHFLLSQRMRKQPAKGNLLLCGSLVRQREAGAPTSAEILISLAPVIAGLHFFQCSLAPFSWLAGEQEGRSLNGHSAAQASGRANICSSQQTQWVHFHHLHPSLFYCPFKVLHYYFFKFKNKCDAFKEINQHSQAGWTLLW